MPFILDMDSSRKMRNLLSSDKKPASRLFAPRHMPLHSWGIKSKPGNSPNKSVFQWSLEPMARWLIMKKDSSIANPSAIPSWSKPAPGAVDEDSASLTQTKNYKEAWSQVLARHMPALRTPS